MYCIIKRYFLKFKDLSNNFFVLDQNLLPFQDTISTLLGRELNFNIYHKLYPHIYISPEVNIELLDQRISLECSFNYPSYAKIVSCLLYKEGFLFFT